MKKLFVILIVLSISLPAMAKNEEKYNKHIVDRLTVYYNKTGKDFNDTPVTPIKYNM